MSVWWLSRYAIAAHRLTRGVADTIFYGASGSKRDGILRLPARALHLELPRSARLDGREPYLAILAEFLAQAATLPAGR